MVDKKLEYEPPTIEIVVFEVKDSIANSGAGLQEWFDWGDDS